MPTYSEFLSLASKGDDVMKFAMGVIMASIFTSCVQSFTEDLLMPPISASMSQTNLSDNAVELKPGTATSPPIRLKWGNFVQVLVKTIVSIWFLFILFNFYIMLKSMARYHLESTWISRIFENDKYGVIQFLLSTIPVAAIVIFLLITIPKSPLYAKNTTILPITTLQPTTTLQPPTTTILPMTMSATTTLSPPRRA